MNHDELSNMSLPRSLQPAPEVPEDWTAGLRRMRLQFDALAERYGAELTGEAWIVGGNQRPTDYPQDALPALPTNGVFSGNPDHMQTRVRIGRHPCGAPVYEFTYRDPWRSKWGDGSHVGMLVEDLARCAPFALVVDAEGQTVIDYGFL